MRSTSILSLACCGQALAGYVAAADVPPYPNKSIRLIVPNAAGGSTDALARAVGQKLGDATGQQTGIKLE